MLLQVRYVHRGAPTGRLALRVSDGVDSGATAVLRVSAFDLQLFLVNSSAVTVPVNGSALLTPAHLSFATNAPDQPLDVRFDVARPPHHGQLQKWKPGPASATAGSASSGRWQAVAWFTSTQLERERIRYVHLNGSTGDDFKLAVSVPEAAFHSATVAIFPAIFSQQKQLVFNVALGVSFVLFCFVFLVFVGNGAQVYEVRVQFQTAVIRTERNAGLAVAGGRRDGRIGGAQLRFVTEPVDRGGRDDQQLRVAVVRPPRYGSLWIAKTDADADADDAELWLPAERFPQVRPIRLCSFALFCFPRPFFRFVRFHSTFTGFRGLLPSFAQLERNLILTS